jgi:hypothetical protein
MRTLHMESMWSGMPWFMKELVFHPRALGYCPRRKTDATIGFGLGAIHKVVLGPVQVIRQLLNRAHSHSRVLRMCNEWAKSVMTLHMVTAVHIYGGIKRVWSNPDELGQPQIHHAFRLEMAVLRIIHASCVTYMLVPRYEKAYVSALFVNLHILYGKFKNRVHANVLKGKSSVHVLGGTM